MRKFTKVSPALWNSPRFKGLASAEARLAYMYLLTCSHQNITGCFWLPDGYACNDLRWDVEQYKTARDELQLAGLILFNQDEEFVWIERWFQHNPPMNNAHLIGVQNEIENIPCERLKEVCIQSLEAFLKAKEAKNKKEKARKEKSNPGVPERLQTPYLASDRRHKA